MCTREPNYMKYDSGAVC
ncbi:hypothetical protein F383_24792 [Gossypium arboreum]|uniref:Uncharacterized protein n=1 Tax=Gossypium arboreum TaxID=29729 RepID=A0A0B0P0G1_GOSAR|nr:hypothetical protein F383_24792 [Gossypium arboreum]